MGDCDLHCDGPDLVTPTTYPITNGSPATVTFTSVTPDPTNPLTALIVDVPTALANGGTATVHAHIVGTDGQPMQGAKVVFTTSGGTANTTAVVVVVGTGYTDANGDVFINITNPNVGTVDFTATAQYGSGPVVPVTNGSPAEVNFVVGPPDQNHSYFIVTQDYQLANGQAQDIVTAYLFDAQGNPTTGNVNFVVGGSATLKVKTVVGNVVTAVFIDFNPENPQVTGTTDNGVVLYDKNAPANNYVTIHFVVGAAVPGDPSGGGTGGTPPGNGGNPPGGNNGGGSGGPGTNPGGGNGNNSGPSDNNGFTHLFVSQDYRLGDGNGQDSVIAYITDAYKHPLKGEHIQFIIQLLPTSGTATTTAAFTISPLDVVTDDQGMARIALTSTKPGTVFVNAILLSQNVLIDGSYQVVTFTDKPDVNNPKTRIDVFIYEALADGSQQTAVKAHVVDMSGDDMAGVYVKFKIDSGTAQFVGPDSVMTDAEGNAIIYLTSKTPGKVKVTASVQGLEITYGSPVYVKFAMINIYVPKVFTPNNDGTNDLLKPILVGIQTFRYFSVYNRWGNLIFTTEDPNRGWDGTFKEWRSRWRRICGWPRGLMWKGRGSWRRG
ncbi:Ig-like domain-containing protein [Puia sp. P3]|uniref:Ig-like domain-containing protein n=1 Tax=Puia sp. P3 TaxID=3423952 RepID=UPI003D666D2F